MLRNIVIAYLIVINLIAFFQMAADKSRAKKGMRRIREKVLFLTAAIGGSIGAIAGMSTFRHKTKHMSFVIGMPAILLAHIAVAVIIVILL